MTSISPPPAPPPPPPPPEEEELRVHRMYRTEWTNMISGDEINEKVGTSVHDLMNQVMEQCLEVYVQTQLAPHAAVWAKDYILQFLEQHVMCPDEGEGLDESSKAEDAEPVPCPYEAWAQGCVPVIRPTKALPPATAPRVPQVPQESQVLQVLQEPQVSQEPQVLQEPQVSQEPQVLQEPHVPQEPQEVDSVQIPAQTKPGMAQPDDAVVTADVSPTQPDNERTESPQTSASGTPSTVLTPHPLLTTNERKTQLAMMTPSTGLPGTFLPPLSGPETKKNVKSDGKNTIYVSGPLYRPSYGDGEMLKLTPKNDVVVLPKVENKGNKQPTTLPRLPAAKNQPAKSQRNK